MTIVRTPRLVLRKAEPGDLAAMHEVLSHPVAMRYWSTLPHETLDETKRWLDSMIEGTGDDFIVTFEGRLIGKAGFFKDPEIGFILHPDYTGRGLGFEATFAVCDRALGLRGLPRVIADADPRNEASLRLLKRLGFVETGRAQGTFQIGDELCDSVFFELTAERFSSLRKRS